MKILVCGDYCPQNRVNELFKKGYYGQILDQVKTLTSSVDYSIVNLECPMVDEESKPVEKKGPNLHCDNNSIKALKYAGFDCVTLANNHYFDYGQAGVTETIKVLKNDSFDYVGGGTDYKEAAQTLYIERGGHTLAIINCCEHEFSIACDDHGGSNPLNPIAQYYSIKEALEKAEYVLVIVHGGHEHFQLPSPRMVETYRFFIDAGADAVVNHHQHCYSGYEIYKGKPVFYGIGNFLFDSYPIKIDTPWNYGYAVVLDFSDEKIGYDIFPYSQCSDNPQIELLQQDAFYSKINELNQIIANPDALNAAIDKYYASCVDEYSSIFEPIRNRMYRAAKRRGFLPSLIGKKRKYAAADFVQCESHRDKLVWWLNSIIVQVDKKLV